MDDEDRPPGQPPGGENGDSLDGLEPEDPELERMVSFGFGGMENPGTWIGIAGGIILLIWGLTWLGAGQLLGLALMVLGVVALVSTVRGIRRRRAARRSPGVGPPSEGA
jgi:Flp pilus assembly protein TadB